MTEGHHQEWSLRLNLTQHGETYPARTPLGLTDSELFLDSVGGGAWPFLVGGVICLVNSDNEQDSSLLNSPPGPAPLDFLEGQVRGTHMRLNNNRSVMPLDVRGRTRATMKAATCVRTPPERAGEPAEPPSCQGSGLVILPVNEEFPVSASHQLGLIKSLPFIHTARRYYQSEALVRPLDCSPARHGTVLARRAVTGRREEGQT